AAHVNNFGIGGRDGQRADGLRGLVVENRQPSLAEVGGLPHTAVVDANVKNIGLAGDAAGGDGAPTAERADHAPAHFLEKIGIELGGGDGAEENEDNTQKSFHASAP